MSGPNPVPEPQPKSRRGTAEPEPDLCQVMDLASSIAVLLDLGVSETAIRRYLGLRTGGVDLEHLAKARLGHTKHSGK